MCFTAVFGSPALSFFPGASSSSSSLVRDVGGVLPDHLGLGAGFVVLAALDMPEAGPPVPLAPIGPRLRQDGNAGEAWPSFTLPDEIGSIVFDPFRISYGAHCQRHKGCRINKVCKKQPLGYLVCWLLSADQFPNAASHKAATHKDAMKQADSPLRWQTRSEARVWFCTLDGSDVWLNREPEGDRTLEPEIIR